LKGGGGIFFFCLYGRPLIPGGEVSSPCRKREEGFYRQSMYEMKCEYLLREEIPPTISERRYAAKLKKEDTPNHHILLKGGREDNSVTILRKNRCLGRRHNKKGVKLFTGVEGNSILARHFLKRHCTLEKGKRKTLLQTRKGKP